MASKLYQLNKYIIWDGTLDILRMTLQLTSTCTFDSLNSAYHLTLVPITNVVAHYGAISHEIGIILNKVFCLLRHLRVL